MKAILKFLSKVSVVLTLVVMGLPAFASVDRAVVLGWGPAGSPLGSFAPSVAYMDGSTLVEYAGMDGIEVGTSTTQKQLVEKAETAIKIYAAASSYPIGNSIVWPWTLQKDLDALIPAGLANAPQAAIANSPADAVTNYNVVTTLLGSLTGAVNAANTKQNDIATKLNALLAELRTLGLISN